VIALWLGLGISETSRGLARYVKIPRGKTVIAGVASSLLIGAMLLTGLQHNNHVRFTYPEDYATAVLESLPPRAVLFARDDVGFGTIAYLHLLNGVRPDVSLYQFDGLVLRNRLFDPRHAVQRERTALLQSFIEETDRPIFLLGAKLPETGYDNLGFYARLRDDIYSPPANVFSGELFNRYVELMQDQARDDSWLDIHRGHLSYQFGWVLGSVSEDIAAAAQLHPRAFEVITDGNLQGLLGLAGGMVSRTEGLSRSSLKEVLEQIEPLLGKATSKEELGRFLHARGVFFLVGNDTESAERELEKSIETWPRPDNVAFDQLSVMYTAQGRTSDLERIKFMLEEPQRR